MMWRFFKRHNIENYSVYMNECQRNNSSAQLYSNELEPKEYILVYYRFYKIL